MSMNQKPATAAPPDIVHDITILDGETFVIANHSGDFTPPGPYGIFHRDTRFLSQMTLVIDGVPTSIISARAVDYYSAAFFLFNKNADLVPERDLTITRLRVVAGGVHEEIRFQNWAQHALTIDVRLELSADFADIFEVKSGGTIVERKVQTIADDNSLKFEYKKGDFYRGTTVWFSLPAELRKDCACWRLDIPPKGSVELSVEISLETEELVKQAPSGKGVFEKSETGIERALNQWEESVPSLVCLSETVAMTYKQAVIDLGALRLHSVSLGAKYGLPAAGLPWFMTLFGRDTLIASYQSLLLSPQLARGAITAFSQYQGKEVHDFTDEQPGRILHELRHDELTHFGALPYSPYYGTADATILYVILLSEVLRWTADVEFTRQFSACVDKAFDWMFNYGDMDGDGFIEYLTRSPQGLRNQGWKDSGDAIQFHDGTIAEPPIALCEVQGYQYDALLRGAELYELWGDEKKADVLRDRASVLRQTFHDAFWVDRRGGFYAIALDRDKRQVDSMTSNMGQLLWTGIVDADKALIIKNHLLSGHMYSGWGIRTLSSEERGFNPIAYHLGTVWPHDNSIIAAGLRRCGFADECGKLMENMLEAARVFDFRLPEAFAGFHRGRVSFPARYPTSDSPQAWASGAALLMLRAVLGLEPDFRTKTLTVAPAMPEICPDLLLKGVHAFGHKFDIKVENRFHGQVTTAAS